MVLATRGPTRSIPAASRLWRPGRHLRHGIFRHYVARSDPLLCTKCQRQYNGARVKDVRPPEPCGDVGGRPMRVVLAEKPSVAREIAAVLGADGRRDGYFEGRGYQVTWALGHLVTLKEPEDYDPALKKWS